jgi:hypothetical protein
MKYIAYIASGEILECDNFKTIFQAARFRVRDDGQVAIICTKSTTKPVAYMLDMFGLFSAFRPEQLHPNMRKLCEAAFNINGYESYVKAIKAE